MYGAALNDIALPRGRFLSNTLASVHSPGEGDAVSGQGDFELDTVCADDAARELIGHAGFGPRPARGGKGGRALFAAQQCGFLGGKRDGLVVVHSGVGDNADLVQQAVKAVGLQQLPCQAGEYVLRVIGGLEDQRFVVHIAHADKAVNGGVRIVQLQIADDFFVRRCHLKLQQGGGGGPPQRAHLTGEGINRVGLVVQLWFGDKGAAALLAYDEPLALQRADGLTHGGTGDVMTKRSIPLQR